MVNKVNKVIEVNFQLLGAGNRLLADSILFFCKRNWKKSKDLSYPTVSFS